MSDAHRSHQRRAFDEVCMDIARRTGRAGTLTVASRDIQTDGSWTSALGSNVSLDRTLGRRDSTRESTWVGVSERPEKIVFDRGSLWLGFGLDLCNGFGFGIFANHRWLFVQGTGSARGTRAVGCTRGWGRIHRSQGGASRRLSVYRRHNRRPFLLLGCRLYLDRLRLHNLCLSRFSWCGAHDRTCGSCVHGAVRETGAFSDDLLVLLDGRIGGVLDVLLYSPGCW
jgi:hypothetical protein